MQHTQCITRIHANTLTNLAGHDKPSSTLERTQSMHCEVDFHPGTVYKFVAWLHTQNTHTHIPPLGPCKVYFQLLLFLIFQSHITIQLSQPNAHPPTFVSHLLLVPWDPFGLDGAKTEAWQHLVQDLHQKNLQTEKNKTHRSIAVYFHTSTPPWRIFLSLPRSLFPCHLPSVTKRHSHEFVSVHCTVHLFAPSVFLLFVYVGARIQKHISSR